jgi:hypothetical protein
MAGFETSTYGRFSGVHRGLLLHYLKHKPEHLPDRAFEALLRLIE